MPSPINRDKLVKDKKHSELASSRSNYTHMKRFARILGLLLLLIISAMLIMYTVRKHKIDEQYVSSASTSILSVAVDDLILDHLSSLLTVHKKQGDTTQSDTWMKKMLFNAGIYIPARIHLFTIAPQEAQFYGILQLRNYDACFSFFANHFPEGINFVDKENSLVSVRVDQHMKVLFDRHTIVYKLSLGSDSSFTDLQSILSNPEGWRKIGSMKDFEHASSRKHIAYAQKDGRLKMEANIKSHKAEIDGEWLLAQDLKDELMVRDMDTTKQALIFWNVLPFSEVPVLAAMMHKFTALDENVVNSTDYFDLQISDDTVLQQDTAIAYAYDEDFNVIEQLQVNESTVPRIVHSWRYNKLVAEEMPNALFYKFHKKRVGEFLLNSTSASFPDRVNNKQTKHPLYLYIDFERWPTTWEASIFSRLKDAKVKARIRTTPQNKRTLFIKGDITYSK